MVIPFGCRRDSSGHLLQDAAFKGDDAAVASILARNPGAIDYQDPSAGMTPLEFAVIAEKASTVKILLAHGANANLGDFLGMSPMGHAVRKGNWAVAQLLVDHGARVNGVYLLKDKVSLLMIAAIEGHRSVAEHLLALGADRTYRDLNGFTAWDYARRHGNWQLAALLNPSQPTSKP
jgi:ankyrin repeat protein